MELLRSHDPKDYERVLQEHNIHDYRNILQAMEFLKREKEMEPGRMVRGKISVGGSIGFIEGEGEVSSFQASSCGFMLIPQTN